ncbi:MAG TPA: recombinase family protein [Rubricoccaceae bacterium]|jgi:DNA invertase Pin-like site-specific DNA recombinase
MLVGYARVSTADQSLDLQRDALARAGADRVFDDTASGVRTDRAGLADALAFVREGDVLAVWRLDRLGRSLADLIAQVETLRERGVGFRSLTEGIDTTTPGGQLVFHIFGALAQFERELIRERTVAGMESARARGRTGGRKPALTRRQVELASRLIRDRETSIEDVCAAVGGVGRSTLYRYVGPDGTVRQMPTA